MPHTTCVRFKDPRLLKYIDDHGGSGGDDPIGPLAERLLIAYLFGEDERGTAIKQHRRKMDAKRMQCEAARVVFERLEVEMSSLETQAGRELGMPLIRAEEAERARLLREDEERKAKAEQEHIAQLSAKWARAEAMYRMTRSRDILNQDEVIERSLRAIGLEEFGITVPEAAKMLKEGRRPADPYTVGFIEIGR